jgi:inner membrane protein YidH
MSTRSWDDSEPNTTRLGLDRTWLAHERTLMAWVRTATGMIAFGFTIYKFFQHEVWDVGRKHVITPRDFALMMISISLIALLLATIGRRRGARVISKELGRSRGSLAEIVAGLIFVFGTLVLLDVAL